MTPLRTALRKLPLSILLLAILGLAACDFGIAALTWWVAHQGAWWTLSLGWTGGSLLWWFGKATISVFKERRP